MLSQFIELYFIGQLIIPGGTLTFKKVTSTHLFDLKLQYVSELSCMELGRDWDRTGTELGRD